MNGPEYIQKAESLAEQANAWMNADTGWKAQLSTAERLAYRAADLSAAQVYATLAVAVPDDQPLTIYRASHDSIVMGLYTTREAARAHCEAGEGAASATDRAPFDWIEDEEDGVDEMTAWTGGEECTTGYVVTALVVATEYDPEADA